MAELQCQGHLSWKRATKLSTMPSNSLIVKKHLVVLKYTTLTCCFIFLNNASSHTVYFMKYPSSCRPSNVVFFSAEEEYQELWSTFHLLQSRNCILLAKCLLLFFHF